ncbi:MAG: LuxR family transcriptional regulator [Emcibacteraceae bacterium]
MSHNYFDQVQNFIEQSAKANNLVDLARLFDLTIRKLGCTHFICLSHVDVFNLPEDAVLLSNYPLEWGLYHHEKQYFKNDPIMDTCKSRITPFIWSDPSWRALLNIDKEKILNEASEFELGEGHTIPIHSGDGYSASCSVVFQPGEVDPHALMAIQLMAIYLYETAIKMKTKSFSQRKKPTARQIECLQMIAMGKSDWAVSKILGISENTVKFHVKAILNHYKVATRNQAVIRALFYGDISYMDVEVNKPVLKPEQSGFIHLPR